MNKNLLILCDSAYGTVAKEIALSMECFEKVDVLNQHFDLPEAEGEYHEISVGKLEDYEKFAGTYSYAVAAFEDSHTRLAWSDKLIEAGFAIISLIFHLSNQSLIISRHTPITQVFIAAHIVIYRSA